MMPYPSLIPYVWYPIASTPESGPSNCNVGDPGSARCRRGRRISSWAMTGTQVARTLLIRLGMDTAPHPRSTPPHIPRRRARVAAGDGTPLTSSTFNQIIFASLIVDLAAATVCWHRTGSLGDRRRARSVSTGAEATGRTTRTD